MSERTRSMDDLTQAQREQLAYLKRRFAQPGKGTLRRIAHYPAGVGLTIVEYTVGAGRQLHASLTRLERLRGFLGWPTEREQGWIVLHEFECAARGEGEG